MKAIRVIGIGSPFGNDNIGWRVIARLQQIFASVSTPVPIDLIESDRPGINLVHMLAGAEFVILIDAILAADRHGQVIQLDSSQLIERHEGISTHALDVSSAIALAAKLRSLPPRLQIVALGIDNTQSAPFDDIPINKLANTVVSLVDEYICSGETA